MSLSSTSSPISSLNLIEVLDLLISDFFLNFSGKSLKSQQNTYLKDSMFYLMKSKPSLSLKDYMTRFQTFTRCSKEIFLIGFIYFDRVIQKNRFAHQRLNIHK